MQCYYLSNYSDIQRGTTPFYCNHPSAKKLKPGKDYVLFPDLRCLPGKCKNFIDVSKVFFEGVIPW